MAKNSGSKNNAASMANSIVALKKVYGNKPVKFAGGLTLNIDTGKCKY